jgi:hypothetical protein
MVADDVPHPIRAIARVLSGRHMRRSLQVSLPDFGADKKRFRPM